MARSLDTASPGHPDSSGIRRARRAKGLTQEGLCAALDQLAGGDSGVTPSMVSNWERYKHATSVKFRAMLAAYFGQPVEVLFADQDSRLNSAAETPRLLVGHHDLRQAMADVVRGARTYLAVLGSRSRDEVYLTAIESALADHPELIHYRVLFGPPRHAVLHAHLLRLLALRDPKDRSHGVKTLHIGVVDDDPGTPERFFCASETAAVIPIPSLTSADAFDSGIALGAGVAERLIDHARQCYAGARKVETDQALHDLPIVRS